MPWCYCQRLIEVIEGLIVKVTFSDILEGKVKYEHRFITVSLNNLDFCPDLGTSAGCKYSSFSGITNFPIVMDINASGKYTMYDNHI